MNDALNHEGYCLSLSDGNNWRITGDINSKQLVSKFANIMRLKECESNGSQELFFSKCITGNNHNITHCLKESGWQLYKDKTNQFWYHNGLAKVICEYYEDSDECISMWLSHHHIFLRSISLGGLPIHAGLAELNGQGVLFAATGNTGKSTCCRRLPNPWKALCDDEALVVLDTNGKYRTHPFPTWGDYIWKRVENTWDVSYSVPLSAIFFIEQSENDEAIPLEISYASISMANLSYQILINILRYMDQEKSIAYTKEIFYNAYDIVKKIPAFRLQVSLNGSFWKEVEKVMT